MMMRVVEQVEGIRGRPVKHKAGKTSDMEPARSCSPSTPEPPYTKQQTPSHGHQQSSSYV